MKEFKWERHSDLFAHDEEWKLYLDSFCLTCSKVGEIWRWWIRVQDGIMLDGCAKTKSAAQRQAINKLHNIVKRTLHITTQLRWNAYIDMQLKDPKNKV